LEALFPLHFFADCVLDKGTAPEEPEQRATDKMSLRCQRAEKVKQKNHSLMFGIVLYCVGVGIIEQQRAPFLPGASHITDIHKAAFRLWRDNQSEMTAHQPFSDAVVGGNYFARGKDGEKGVLDSRDVFK
jgi:hypothetical protein